MLKPDFKVKGKAIPDFLLKVSLSVTIFSDPFLHRTVKFRECKFVEASGAGPKNTKARMMWFFSIKREKNEVSRISRPNNTKWCGEWERESGLCVSTFRQLPELFFV